MNCPNCHETVEDDASFCGNCGQSLKSQAQALGSIGLSHSVPAYALAHPAQHIGEIPSVAALLLGVAGLAGSLFVPLLGLAFGLFGMTVGTSAHITHKRVIRTAGLIISGLAILAGLATWAQAVRSDPRVNPDVVKAKPTNSSTLSAADYATPCYSLSFIDQLNIDQGKQSCDINAYNGKNLSTSTNAYKILSIKSNISSANDFTNMARDALEKDAHENFTGFNIDSEKVSTFAGSPAYFLNASDKISNVSIVEAAVMHKVAKGDNVFILVHANTGSKADLQIMESNWQWK